MYGHNTGMKNNGKKVLIRRILAAVLLFALLFGALPTTAFAASGDMDKKLDSLSWKPFNSLDNTLGQGGPAITRATYKYILEVSTGTIRDNGEADNVLYFNLYYNCSLGVKNVVLMPQLDAVSNGYNIAAEFGNRKERMREIEGKFYTNFVGGNFSTTALKSVSTTQILFETNEKITSIEKLQIFGQHTASEMTWSVQSLRVYRVDKLYGLDMYGWYSNNAYIDFDGVVICDMVMSSTGGNFKWKTTGGTFNVLKYGVSGGIEDCKLVNDTQRSSYAGPTSAGAKHSSQQSHLTTLRIDIADQGFAGLESLACLYENGSSPSLAAMEFAEVASLIVRYTDTWGSVREVSLPFAMNAIGSLEGLIPNAKVAGFAQQGNIVAMPLMLPDYASIVNVSMLIGSTKTYERCKLKPAGSMSPARQARMKTTETDDLRYTCCAVYEDPSKCEVAMDGATPRFRFKGDPVKSTSGTSMEGLKIPANTETYFYLSNFTEKSVLEPKDSQERYLVTLYTDNVLNAGTMDDVQIEFGYVDLQGKSVTSPGFSVRDYATQFYGEWAGNKSNFAYSYGMSQGGTIRFMIPLNNVSRFTSVSYHVTGADEWQVKACTIQFVESYEKRVGAFVETNSKEKDPDQPNKPRFHSYLQFTREVDAGTICFSAGAVTGDMAINPDYDPDDDPAADPASEDWVPGDLIQEEEGWKTIDSEGKEVIIRDDVDWNDLIRNMTYEDTAKDLGFTKMRRRYTVHVRVAKDKVTDNNDDCGSANLFYFQLIFENGASGCVLANQQIDGDAFRTGADVYFDIPTVIDYGELTSLMIIPDDQDSNGNIYDKLKIDYIDVMLNTDAAIIPTWKFQGSQEDGLGWVGIEYRDPGEAGTIRGSEGHNAAEIATTYEVTASTYSAKLLISVSTGAYQRNKGTDADGLPKYEDCDQMIAGMSLSYTYEDVDGQVHTGVDGGDVVYLMDQYAGRPSSYNRVYDDGLKSTEVDYAVSNPEYLFRGGKTDRFFLTVTDITKLNNMSFFVKSDRSTNWTINSVSVHLVNGTGRRYINASGELAYKYNKGEELQFITESTNEEPLEVVLPVYGGGTSGKQQVDIQFKDAGINTDKQTNTWTPVINREPKSKNDTLNLFIYPSTAERTADPSTYNLNASIVYTDAMTMEPMTAGCDILDFSYDENNQPVFSKIGVSAPNLESISYVSVRTASAGTLPSPMSYGILQRVRSGVLIDTYYLTGVVNADKKSSMNISAKTERDTAVQRLFLQVYANNPPQDLVDLSRDVAVALYFSPAGVPGQEIRSKYVYLSDVGYKNIKPGQILELDFDLGNVGEVLGINIIKTGSLDISFENAMIVSQASSGEVLRQYSFENGFVPSAVPSRVNVTGDVEMLKLNIKTANATESSGGGTNDPVRATIGYYDINGQEQTDVINDIRPYLESNKKGKALNSGGTDTFEYLMSRLKALRYVKLEPYNADDATYASWTLESIDATVGINGAIESRAVNKTIVEEQPETIFIEEMILISSINVRNSDGTIPATAPELTIQETPDGTAKRTDVFTVKSPEIGTLTVESGNRVSLATRVSGSPLGFNCKFMQIDPLSGLEEPADLSKGTYSYKEEELDEIYQLAIKSIGPDVTNEKEIEAAKAVIDLINAMRSGKGSFLSPDSEEFTSKDIVFQTPRNYSDQKLQYRIVATAKENPTCSYTLDVIVGKEEDQLQKAIENWEKVRAVADVKVLNQTGAAEDEISLLHSDRKSLLIESGEGVLIIPRVSESDTFTAVINSYDSATQAKGRADLAARHSYTEDTLLRYESEANTILSAADSTDEERTEAQNVLNTISAIRAGTGTFTPGTSEILLNAPRNYSGSTISYIITVTDTTANEELFSLIVTVNSEADALTAAYGQLTGAKTKADQERADAALKAASEEAASKAAEESSKAAEESSSAAESSSSEEPSGSSDENP